MLLILGKTFSCDPKSSAEIFISHISNRTCLLVKGAQ